jgi:hypothetical protein
VSSEGPAQLRERADLLVDSPDAFAGVLSQL